MRISPSQPRNSRILLLLLGLFFFWSILVLRAIQLQIIPDERLAQLQSRQYRTVVELAPRRGSLIDRHGQELAISLPSFSVYADPQLVQSPLKTAKDLSAILQVHHSIIFEKIKNKKSGRRFVWIERHLDKTKAESIRKLKLKGVALIEESKRVYPNETVLSQVMGFVGQDGRGLEGLEKWYDDILSGEKKQMQVHRDARGRPLLVNGQLFLQPPVGANIQLSIDSELQYVVERYLSEALTQHDADSAMAIVLDARSSEVLALAHAPLFDGNKPLSYPNSVWRNRAASDIFEPGSTLKSIIVAGALERGYLKPSTKYFCENGRYKVGPFFIKESDSKHRYGWLTVSEIIALSSNIGTAKIAEQIGSKEVFSILKDFGFNQKYFSDWPGEARGQLADPPWRPHHLANISFGHGIAATGMQVAIAYAAIANGGWLRSPQLIRSIQVNDKEKRDLLPARPPEKRVLSAENAALMRMILQQATSENSTGFRARVPGFTVGGKTGTAQKVSSRGGYEKGQYISSFAGFIPTHQPQFVIYISVDNPKRQFYGSEVAAPLFSRIAGYAVRRFGLVPTVLTEKNMIQKKSETQIYEEKFKQIRTQASVLAQKEQNKVPVLQGLTLREVYTHIRGTGWRVQVVGQGRVRRTDPEPGHDRPSDGLIKIWLE